MYVTYSDNKLYHWDEGKWDRPYKRSVSMKYQNQIPNKAEVRKIKNIEKSPSNFRMRFKRYCHQNQERRCTDD